MSSGQVIYSDWRQKIPSNRAFFNSDFASQIPLQEVQLILPLLGDQKILTWFYNVVVYEIIYLEAHINKHNIYPQK